MAKKPALAILVWVIVLLTAAHGSHAQTSTPAPSPAVPHVAMMAPPDSAAAEADLGRFLNLRTGKWAVLRVNPEKMRETYEMDAVVDLTVEAGGAPRKADLENDPWLAQFSGTAGEKKSIPVTLTWVKTEAGWKLRSIETRDLVRAK